MTLTREVESLAARYWRVTAHDMRIYSAPSWRWCKCARRRCSCMVRGGANWRAYRGVALHYPFVGRWFSLERLKTLQRDANAPQFMTWGRRDARASLFAVTAVTCTFTFSVQIHRGSEKQPFHVVRQLTTACFCANITAPGFRTPRSMQNKIVSRFKCGVSGGLSEYFPTDRPSAPVQQREGVPDRPTLSATGHAARTRLGWPDRPTLPRRPLAGSDPPDRPSQKPPRDAETTFNFASSARMALLALDFLASIDPRRSRDMAGKLRFLS